MSNFAVLYQILFNLDEAKESTIWLYHIYDNFFLLLGILRCEENPLHRENKLYYSCFDCSHFFCSYHDSYPTVSLQLCQFLLFVEFFIPSLVLLSISTNDLSYVKRSFKLNVEFLKGYARSLLFVVNIIRYFISWSNLFLDIHLLACSFNRIIELVDCLILALCHLTKLKYFVL